MRVGSKVSLLLLSVALTSSLSARAESASSLEIKNESTSARKWSGQWNLNMGGTSMQEGKDEGAAAYVWFSTDFKYRFAKWLNAEISPNLSFYSSRLQERFDDDIYENRIWLMNSHISLTPVEFLEFRAGALNQGFLGSSMLISGLRSFPGVQEIVKINSGDIEAKVILQQAVPSSHTLNTERERQEKLPSFNTETFSVKGKHLSLIEWESTGGHFKWANLPSKVAWESRMAGNLGSGVEVPDSKFSYDHEGWFATAEVCLCTGAPVDFTFEFQRIKNTKAPSFAADAQMWGMGPKIKMGDRELSLRYRNYFIESDATVAIYNRSKFGHTNRVGNSLEARLRFKDLGFDVFSEAYLSKPINASESQRDLSIYFLGVETAYAPF